jgi:uncharacterized protein YacL (UPF0231 family)
MKKSDLKSYIRENIIEILSEEEGTITTKDSTEAEKLAKKGINVNLTKEEVSLNIQQKKKETQRLLNRALNKYKKSSSEEEKEKFLKMVEKYTKVQNELDRIK